jgi:hypothetical protein
MARLTVGSTHDYRNDPLSDITEIHWTLNWHATFAPSQFDDVQIASNVQLGQSTATQLEMRIFWSSPTGFSAGNWTFAGVWPSDALIRFQGSTGADIVVGSAKKDFFEVSGADILAGGAEHDTFFWAGPIAPGTRIDGGTGGDRLLFNGNVDFSSAILNNVEVVDFNRASHGSATFTAAQFAGFTAVTGFHFFEPIFQEDHFGGSESLIINGAP